MGLVTQSCPTLCDPMDCSPQGSTVYETVLITVFVIKEDPTLLRNFSNKLICVRVLFNIETRSLFCLTDGIYMC